MTFIVVGVPIYKDAYNEFGSCLIELQKKGITINSVNRTQTTVITPNCRIKFWPENAVARLYGLKYDASFGFSEKDQCLLNWTHQTTNYDGSFLDYIYEIEGIKE